MSQDNRDKCPVCSKYTMPRWSMEITSCENARMCQNKDCNHVEVKTNEVRGKQQA